MQLLLFSIAIGLVTAILIALVGYLAFFAPTVKIEHQRPLFWRLAHWPLAPLEAWLGRYLPFSLSQRLSQHLNSANLARELSPAGIAAAMILSGVLCAGLAYLMLAVIARVSQPSTGLVIMIGLIGLALPWIWLKDCAAKRERQVLKQLPFVLDLIVLAVESGLNLTGAIVETTEKGPPGVLRDELSTVLRDIRAGVTRAEALQNMSDRLRIPAVANLVGGLIAADRQGGSVGGLLRGQAQQRRTERFARAEKLAMQAPVKMLFPLIAFIFPCTFIVLFFPIFHRLVSEGWIR